MIALVPCLLAALCPPQEAPNLAVETPPAARVSVAEAIASGVDYLVRTQNKDGTFGTFTVGRDYEIMASVPGSLDAFRAATAALCWMALDDCGMPSPASKAAAQKTLTWLADHGRVKRANGVEMYNIWAMCYGLRAMSQALREGGKGVPPAQLRRQAEMLVEALQLYLTPDGGVTYYDFDAQSSPPSDSSMSFSTATMLIALDEAKRAGIEVPDKLVQRAVKSVQRCRKADGSYLYGFYLRYQPNMGVNQPKGSSLRTQSCNLALELWNGGVTEQDMLAGLRMLEQQHRFAIAGVRRPIPHESWYQVSGYFYLYGHMYAAMVLQRVPEAERAHFAEVIASQTLKCRDPDGSFWDYPLYGYGKAYGTGYALMTLARVAAVQAALKDGADAATGK